MFFRPRWMRACCSREGRNKLPTWSARNGPFFLLAKLPSHVGLIVLVFPEFVGSNARALGHRLELQPRNLGVAARPTDERAEAAVGAGDHVFLADDVSEFFQALGDEPRVFDVV